MYGDSQLGANGAVDTGWWSAEEKQPIQNVHTDGLFSPAVICVVTSDYQAIAVIDRNIEPVGIPSFNSVSWDALPAVVGLVLFP